MMQGCRSLGFVFALVLILSTAVPAHSEALLETYRKGWELYEAGHHAEAELLLRKALEQAERELGLDHPEVAGMLSDLATLYQATDRPAEAEPLYKRALAIGERTFGPEHPSLNSVLNNLATLYQATDRPAEAESFYKRALAIGERTFGPEHPDLLSTLNNLATLYENTGRTVEAEPLYRRTIAIARKILPASNQNLVTSVDNYAGLLDKLGRGQEAAELRAQVKLMARSVSILQNYQLVTESRLRHPADGEWPMYRRTYEGWGYSPLNQINKSNVKKLIPAWSFATSVTESHQAPPVVINGIMFVTTPQSQVLALDAKTGDLLWRYQRSVPEDMMSLHPTNRGVAVLGDKVYFAAVDAVLVALDAKTGQEAWVAPVAKYTDGYYMTLAPLAAEGKVMVGVSGGETGVRGFIAAFDAETGQRAWTTYTVPAPGEPGSETWPEGDQWKTGGGSIWITGSYDPEAKLSYWGTGNGGPWMGDQRPGDNLYTSSVIAVDVTTGAIRGHHQYHWNDSWDWDEVASPILVDFERDGRTVRGLIHAGRDGYLWLLERAADGTISFVDAKPYVRQNVFVSIDPKTGRPTYDESHKPGTGKKASFCPSMYGGKNWPPTAYSPQTKLFYIPANNNLCSTLEGKSVTYMPGELYTGAHPSQLHIIAGASHIGELQAWRLNRGERAWTYEFPRSANWGPVLATGGELVFMGGTNDRYFRAFDAKNGDMLWESRLSSGVTGVPVTYEIDGRQYIAVQSGWGTDAQRMNDRLAQLNFYTRDVPQGGTLWVFALPE